MERRKKQCTYTYLNDCFYTQSRLEALEHTLPIHFVPPPPSMILFEYRMWPTSVSRTLYYSYIFKTFILPVADRVGEGSLPYSH